MHSRTTYVLFWIGFGIWALSTLVPDVNAQQNTAIVYTNGQELRLIEPDGSNDRAIWTEPDTLFSITGLSWSPDASEIAFASDHEMAVSFYQRDIYAIQPDGDGLRKLTNPPIYEELASYPKGTVTVRVSNSNLFGSGGPFFVYVTGAPELQQVNISFGTSQDLMFTNVADLGEEVFQPVVVVEGLNRWWDAAVAADVQAGSTVNVGTINMTSPIERFGVDAPFWRSDGTRIGFISTAGVSGTATCILQQVPSDPPPGHTYDPLIEPGVYDTPCAVDWAPLPTIADQLLVTDYTDYTQEGKVHVYRATEDSQVKGELVTTFDGYVQVYDIRWIPDGSGFLVAKHDALLERGLNLYEYNFADQSLTKLTEYTVENEGVRGFSISPDGQFVVFEYAANVLEDEPGELWVMRRNGEDMRLLVQEGRFPSWSPQSIKVGAEYPEEVPSGVVPLTVYPQPVESVANVSFSLRQPQDITVKVHDLLGREVSVQWLGYRAIGEYKVSFDATPFNPGVYFIRVIGSEGDSQTARIVVLK